MFRLQILGNSFYIKPGTEVIVENNEKVKFIPQPNDFVFCDGNKLYGWSSYTNSTNTITAHFEDSLNTISERVDEKGSDTFLVEEFISEQGNVDSRIAEYLRANPRDMDVNLGEDSPFDITPIAWKNLNDTLISIENGVFDNDDDDDTDWEDLLDTMVGTTLGPTHGDKFMKFINKK